MRLSAEATLVANRAQSDGVIAAAAASCDRSCASSSWRATASALLRIASRESCRGGRAVRCARGKQPGALCPPPEPLAAGAAYPIARLGGHGDGRQDHDDVVDLQLDRLGGEPAPRHHQPHVPDGPADHLSRNIEIG